MDDFFVLLIILVVGCILSGPVALIIGIIALNKAKELDRKLRIEGFADKLEAKKEVVSEGLKAEEISEPPVLREEQAEVVRAEQPVKGEDTKGLRREAFQGAVRRIHEREKEAVSWKAGTLEQRIGTRWVLVAGVITVIVGVGFFLKYAYDNELIGPLGRVVIATFSGLIALVLGEVTRKRGYGIVAKAVTALGFAILYVAVFSAYRFYSLISSPAAFGLAIFITAAAMLYAVSLNEVLIAVLSLIGGFLTPIVVSTGENLPMPLFSYVLILGIGAVLCGYYRKWRVVNLVAFVGTFALYTGWFEKFFRPAMTATEKVPEQMAVALGWLGVFFVIYLVLPLFYGLVKKVKAQKEDVLLVLGNAAVTFYYLWTVLFAKYQMELAFCAIGLCIGHLVVMSIVIRRCKDDLNLRLGLLAIGLFFLTIAVPLYLKMYAVAMAWAVEGVILTVIGLRYRSIWTRIGAAVAILLSLGQLFYQLPMHTGAFRLVFNPAFGTWLFVAGAIIICHIHYRRNIEIKTDYRSIILQILYASAALVLMMAVTMEWYWHCAHNIAEKVVGDMYFIRGMMLIFTVFTLLPVVRPVCPAGELCKVLATLLALVGSIFAMVGFTESYNDSFVIFANVSFGIAVLFVAGLFMGAWLLKRTAEKEEKSLVFSVLFALAAIFVLWVLLTEQIYLYWYCRNRFAEKVANWRFLSNMYISVMWAVYGAVLMAAGFWRKVRLLRYIALGLFALLLAKVFLMDTSTVKSVYRIAAFLATGVTLVGVSYLYQFLKNRGFFEAMLADKSLDE